MNDAEISRRLALAIGYAPKDIGRFNPPHDMRIIVLFGNGWRLFSYKSPSVIWPIAERFDCFPSRTPWEAPASWSAFFDDSLNSGRTEYVEAETAAKAVALAVIKHHEGGNT